MTKFILGEKVNMTQIFDNEGTAHPVTVIKAGPVVVTQIKGKATEGYEAVQVGFGDRAEKNLSKPVKGHMKDFGSFRYLKEFRMATGEFKVGDTIDLASFTEGEKVIVSSVSKGKGFQGVVKRHGFAGGPRSHGQKHSEREAGSISQGLRTGPHKGLRMAGRMGSDRVTEKNHKVIQIDLEAGLILLNGSVPGRRGTLIEIKA